MNLQSGISYFNIDKIGVLLDGSCPSRPIYMYLFLCTVLDGIDLNYPNILIKEAISPDGWRLPVRERFMSLERDSIYEHPNTWSPSPEIDKYSYSIERPVFFFAYNLDNFYHFMYDTLPYLNGYLKLRRQGVNPLLLISQKHQQYLPAFVKEMFEALGIESKDLLFASKDYQLKELYVITSYTHNGLSTLPPHPKACIPLKSAISALGQIAPVNASDKTYSDKIYISRRTWISNDKSNIGTDFTEKRKFVNEDEVVVFLSAFGFQELFTENMSLLDKVKVFSKARYVISASGGGLANLMLAPKTTSLLVINSPLFWDVNKRLRYAFDHIRIEDFNDTEFTEFLSPLTNGSSQISAEGGLNSPWSCNTISLFKQVKAFVQF